MSRWGKNRVTTSYALPLDALVKEKENTNRPVAARSAGTVGKWGITSFTSIRARPVYGFASFSPNQDTTIPYPQFSPKSCVQESSHIAGNHSSSSNNNAVKPKKFFKSRNSVPETKAYSDPPSTASVASPSYYSNPTSAYNQQQQHQPAQQNATTTKSRKRTKSESPTKKSKVEKTPKPEKPTKVEKIPKNAKKNSKVLEKPSIEPSKPRRVLSRARKIVDYSEDKSRSPPSGQQSEVSRADLTKPDECDPSTVEDSNLVKVYPNLNSTEPNSINDDEQNNLDDSASKLAIGDHPPIVLRISKGTSRLISTDSEGLSGSPPYLSPEQQNVLNIQQTTTATYTSAAASLVAVLSDEPEPSVKVQTDANIVETVNPIEGDENTNTKPKKEKSRSKAEPIKLKIKTTARALRNHSEALALDQSEEQETQRSGRSTKRIIPSHSTHEKIDSENHVNSSLLTSDNSVTDTQQKQTKYLSNAPNTIDIEPFQNQDLIDAPTISGSESQKDYDRGILPKKRRAKNKVSSEEFLQTVAEDTHKKQRGRRRNDQNCTEIDEIATSHSSDAVNVQKSDHCHESKDEQLPFKRMTAAARKQYSLPIQQLNETVTIPNTEEISGSSQNEETAIRSPKSRGRRVKSKPMINTAASKIESMVHEEKSDCLKRITRNNNTNEMMQNTEQQVETHPPTRSYGRKRKLAQDDIQLDVPHEPIESSATNRHKQPVTQSNLNKLDTEASTVDADMVSRGRSRRQIINYLNGNIEEENNFINNNESAPMRNEISTATENSEQELEKPSVKLVISKKKGSIFKSRAIDGESGESKKQKRHVYKHKWDVDDELDEKLPGPEANTNVLVNDVFQNNFDNDSSTSAARSFDRFSRATRTNNPDDDLRIRNVKKAHQMQEIGEFQEMDDDVEYILESLKSQNPIATRSLAAIQLASKCMTPAFRMHVRAHGTATKFFSALHDATQNQSLGLCTATIMFVLIQDNLNMDLDKHSLELMLNLLDSDISRKNNIKETGLSDEQTQRNEQKVIEICREIKNQGKAEHLNLENISIGTLAMETLLTLTSKRAGEWFKDEMRTLGGLEHIINTICECCKEISDCVIEWTEPLLGKLRKIERCLRVLENVSDRNEDNQKYILYFRNGEAVEILSKLYKLCVSEISMNPTTNTTPAGAPGIVLREALVPLLKVLINLTHTFNRQPKGAVLFGEKPIIFDTCLYLLFSASQHIPDQCIFELSLLALLLLINLSGHAPNRNIILNADVYPDDNQNKHQNVPAIKALIEYFCKYEELARFVEQNTDDILNNPKKCDNNKNKSQEDVDETVSKLLQKAGNHMEHTFLASYVCLLIGHLIIDDKNHELKVRSYLRNQSFAEMVQVLEKYYNFMNLTASSEAIQVAHMKETKRIIQFMKESDQHSSEQPASVDETSTSTDLANKTNYSRSYDNRWTGNTSSNTSGSGTSSSILFNKVYHSGK